MASALTSPIRRRCWKRPASRPSPTPGPAPQTYAQAAGVTLGPILSISEGGGEVAPRPMFRVMAMAAAHVPVAPGEQSVTADVSVVWEIH